MRNPLMASMFAGLAAVLLVAGWGAAPARAQWPALIIPVVMADGESSPDGQAAPRSGLPGEAEPKAEGRPLRLSVADALASDDMESASAPEGQEEAASPPADESGEAPQGQGEGEGQGSVSDIASKLANPVGDIWSITNQYNINQLHGRPFSGSRWQNNWNIQPVMPLHLTNDWNLIVRPVVPLFFASPYPEFKLRPGVLASRLLPKILLPPELARTFRGLRLARRGARGGHAEGAISVGTDRLCGIGDITPVFLLSPRKLPKLGNGQLLWGVGPTFVFPTAGPTELGAGKYQAGPAAVAGYLGKKWIAFLFAQQWWSYAGHDGRPDQNHMQIQYTVQYMLAPGLQVGCGSPIINIDWTKKCSEGFTFPVGASVSRVFKVGKLPIKLAFEYDYAVVHPTDDLGQRSIFRITVAPVLPALIKENLLGS